MPFTTIKKPSDYFNTKLYTGNGGTQSITGVGFQPDWVWIKERSSTSSHALFDAIRGATIKLSSNNTDADNTSTADLTSFDSDGFTNGDSGAVNESGQTYASWNWKANGAGSANTDGSITATVSANTTAGFSIVSYTGTNATGTVGHGLGTTPKIVLYKNRTDVTYWYFTTSLIDGSHDLLLLPATDAQQPFSASLPTSSVLNLIANNDTNGSGDNIIAYCFAEKTGYSKFGSYVGNNNSDGTFVYTGFKPAFIIMKSTASGENWTIYDNKRAPSNPSNVRIYANLNNAESSSTDLDLLSNGFKLRTTGGNSNDGTLIYMAFAEQPLVGDNPATAR